VFPVLSFFVSTNDARRNVISNSTKMYYDKANKILKLRVGFLRTE